jgi:hypothetical protein
MSTESIVRAVRAAFQDERAVARAGEYLAVVRENWGEAERRTTHVALLALLAAVVGELSLQGAVSEIEVAGVKLQNAAFLSLLCPLVVAYCYFNLFEAVVAGTIYQDVHDAIVSECFPSLRCPELDEAVYPPSPITVPMSAGFGHTSAKLVGVVRPLVLLLGIPSFLALYYTQAVGASAANVLTYLGLAVTVLLLAATVPSIATAVRGYVEWMRS